MSRYERAYGTDWTALDEDEAIDRAYALGVAASTGEYHPDELDRIREAVDTAYSQSVVDLAFEEGRTEAREADADPDSEADRLWAALVGETPDGDADPVGGRDGPPGALDSTALLDRAAVDSTERTRLPEFLRR